MFQLYRAVVGKDEVFVRLSVAERLQNTHHVRLPVMTRGFLWQISHHDGGTSGHVGLELDGESEINL